MSSGTSAVYPQISVHVVAIINDFEWGGVKACQPLSHITSPFTVVVIDTQSHTLI